MTNDGFKLRNGDVVSDRRLGRLEEFDTRSRAFPIRPQLKSTKRRSYTWRCDINLDQGAEGACVGFGIAHELVARPAEVQDMTNEYARKKIYWNAQYNDMWEGGAYPGAVPFYEGTSVIAGIRVARYFGWFEEYRWAFDLEDLILGVGHNGPAVLGVRWYENMAEPDNNNYINVSGRVMGGHCILCNAVNVKEERFTLHNSWGPYWGDKGECYISFSDMGKLLDNNGEAAFFLHRHNLARP
ncbi:MAG: hypothetical protein DRI65_04420 [Chloroflexota bacterium]|nr:MAG: hypothetical protein DRI65_04420 [Chloroflexota bacterium]